MIFNIENVHYIWNAQDQDDHHHRESFDSCYSFAEQIDEEGSLCKQSHPVEGFVPNKEDGTSRQMLLFLESVPLVEEKVMLYD